MAPDISFQDSLSKHLDVIKAREEAVRQNQIWTIQLFQQASFQSIQATHSRDALIELQHVCQEVELVINEIQILMPVIVWIWGEVKNLPEVMAHLSSIEKKVRDRYRHHERHGYFFEHYEKNQNASLDLFKTSLQNLQTIFNQPDGWFQDPISALRRIHDAQDGVVLTGLFLELLFETVTGRGILDHSKQQKLAQAIGHLGRLGQKLHLKEDRLRKAVKAAEGLKSER